MKVQQSAEDYLESIYKLSLQKGQVRSIDIVNDLNYSKPSISFAMKRLRENGFIYMDANNYITLTEKGLEVATRVYHRHFILTEFFTGLGVDGAAAREDACKIEHLISDESFGAIERITNK